MSASVSYGAARMAQEPRITGHVLQTHPGISLRGRKISPSLARELGFSTRDTFRPGNAALPFLPLLYVVDSAVPGRNILLTLCLDIPEQSASDYQQCTLDSLIVVISTFTRWVYGRRVGDQDEAVQHVTCVSHRDMDLQVPFNTRIPLVKNFRLSDDAECIPTVKTSTISRSYELTVALTLKCDDQAMRFSSSTPLTILPRMSGSPASDDTEAENFGADPLPIYHLPAPAYSESLSTGSLPLSSSPSTDLSSAPSE